VNIKQIKYEIRTLRKLKLQCRAGTVERIKLHRKIKAFKKELKELKREVPKVEEIKVEESKYKTIYYTGYLSEHTKQRMRDNYNLNFTKRGEWK